jgi:hypothetical protein
MKNILLILIFTLFISGCASTTAPTFYVYVDSISSPKSQELKRYILLPNNQGVKSGDLQFQEYASYVEKALNSQGFTKANDFKDANVAIFLGYGIGDPKTHQYTYSMPTWGKTGVSSSNTYGTVNSYGSTATVSSTTTYTPTYGVTGSTSHVGSYTTFNRYLSINALDLNQYKVNEEEKQIWKTQVMSSGSSGDLRRVFPILVAASRPYISVNSGQKIEVSLKEQDQQVLEIKGIKNLEQ